MLFIEEWVLVYHSSMLEKLSFILADATSLVQPHMNLSFLYIVFILAPAAMRNAQKCSLLGSTLVEGNVYSISQEMVRFKIIHEPHSGIFENMSVSICPGPQALSSWFQNF